MIVLDTRVLIWLDQASDQLGTVAREQLDIVFNNNDLNVSAISFWEIAMLQSKGRVELPSLRRWRNELLDMGLGEIPVDGEIGILVNRLNDFHPDPADTLIVATALSADATLATADGRILEWAGGMHRLDAGRLKGNLRAL
jgi:PIN domain nuclease of toxin-antitoxin system